MSQRVLITGMGGICAAGAAVPGLLANFATGQRNVGPLSLFDSTLALPVFEVRQTLTHTGAGASRTRQLVFHALTEALAAARMDLPRPGMRVGVCMGTTVASQLNDIAFYAAYRKAGVAPLEPVENFLKGNLAQAVADRVRADGPCLTVVNACSSSADAIGVALSWLRNDMCDLVVAGGGDELNRVPLCGFHALSVYSQAPCRPFDRDRAGLNLGEGAAVLVLETEASARQRGVGSDLFMAGYGAACDAYHLTAPRPDGSGLETAIRRSLAEAELQPGQITFVNAHGTATRDNDRVEGQTLARIFGTDIRVLSTKGFTGHTLGAAGALEAVFTALALREGWIPACAGFENPDAEIPVAVVRERTAIQGQFALSTSLAFGGNNAALVMGRGA